MRLPTALIVALAALTDAGAQTKTWQSYYFQNSAIPPVIIGTQASVVSPAPTPTAWTGFLSSVQTSSFLTVGFGTDNAGDSYTLFSQGKNSNTSIPLGYVSKYIPSTQSTEYFAINGVAPFMLGVSPSGDVFILGVVQSTGTSTVYELGTSGVLNQIFQVSNTYFNVGNGLPGPATVDANDNVSIGANTLIGAGTYSPATYLLVTSGPIPFAVPLADSFTSGTAIAPQVTSTLPLTYQWSLNGAPIPGATSASYTPASQGIYSVTASTSAGSVTLSTTVFAAPAAPVTPPGQLINISTRGNVTSGSGLLIGGFVISGSANEQVLIRAIGPTLSEFSVSGALAQPVLTVFNSSGTQIATNTGWSTNSNAAQISAAFTSTGAFVLPVSSADSAVLLSLAPGAYTVQVSGLNGTAGNALVEVYEVPSIH